MDGLLPGLDDKGCVALRRVWLENGFRTVRIVGKARNGDRIVEWCDSGRWRKKTLPESDLMDINFGSMPIASLEVPVLTDAPKPKRKYVRRKK